MNYKICAVLLAGFLAISISSRAQDHRLTSREDMVLLANGLKYQQGEVELRNGLAKLEVPKEFKFLGPADAESVLVKLWGNPPGAKSLGMLLPADKTPLEEDCWAVTISFSEDGYVKDDDAAKINYNDLLKSMQKASQQVNAEREKQGYMPIEIVGWAEPPHYDAATHKLYWAKEIKFGHQTENTLNYNIRMLGRRGVLVLNVVATMDQLKEVESQTPKILAMVNFNDGNRYADFDPKVDKVAAYGIAALVAGGIAAKLGLFKLLWVFLLAAKKFVIIGFAAAATWLKKIFGRKKSTPALSSATAPPPPEPIDSSGV